MPVKPIRRIGIRKADLPAERRAFYDQLDVQHTRDELSEPICDLPLKQRSPRKPPEQREKNEVQRPLVVFLRKHLPAGSTVHAQAIQPLNQNHRFAMQRDGVQFGMPDVHVVVPWSAMPAQSGHYLFKIPFRADIECKHPDGGSLNENQEYTQGLLTAAGAPVLSECRSVKEAYDWLESLGVRFRP